MHYNPITTDESVDYNTSDLLLIETVKSFYNRCWNSFNIKFSEGRKLKSEQILQFKHPNKTNVKTIDCQNCFPEIISVEGVLIKKLTENLRTLNLTEGLITTTEK